MYLCLVWRFHFFLRFYIIIFLKKSRFMTFLPELPQKYSHLGGLSQTLLMTFIINNSLSVLVWGFQLLLLGLGFLLSDPQNLYSFLLKTPQKHTLCVSFIIFIKSVIISNPWSVFVPSLENPLSSLDFLWTYSQKITFHDIFCIKCPKNSVYG